MSPCGGTCWRGTHPLAADVVIVVQARSGSTRLPNKVMLPFGESTLLLHILGRLRRGGHFDVRLATSNHPRDDEVAAAGRSTGCAVFRGPDLAADLAAVRGSGHPDFAGTAPRAGGRPADGRRPPGRLAGLGRQRARRRRWLSVAACRQRARPVPSACGPIVPPQLGRSAPGVGRPSALFSRSPGRPATTSQERECRTQRINSACQQSTQTTLIAACADVLRPGVPR